MASGRMEFHAESIMQHANFCFVLPNDVNMEEVYDLRHYDRPTRSLILLHGLTGTDSDWLFGGVAQEMAIQYNLAVFMPTTGNSVFAARAPARGAALPAAAMITPKPFSAAPCAKAAASAGVRCAEMTRASTGMSRDLSALSASFTTGRSLSLPMMTATFFNTIILPPFGRVSERSFLFSRALYRFQRGDFIIFM